MRRFELKTDNVDVRVGQWSIDINYHDLSQIIRDNVEEGNFWAKVTIVIEETEGAYSIQSNKPEPEPEPEQEEVQDNEE